MGAGVTPLLPVGEPVALGVPPKNCEKSGAGGNGGFCEKSGIGGKGGISKPGIGTGIVGGAGISGEEFNWLILV